MIDKKVGQSILEIMQKARDGRVLEVNDGVLGVDLNCCGCGSALTIDEMHYLANGNGKATCCACEGKWSDEVTAWRSGEPGEFPSRPGMNVEFPKE
jgi:hypothetical protein